MRDVKLRAIALCGVLLLVARHGLQPRIRRPTCSTSTALTLFPSYRINDSWSGFGYLGWVSQAGRRLQRVLPRDGRLLHAEAVGPGLGSASSASTPTRTPPATPSSCAPSPASSSSGRTLRKWRYYNWTRYELRLTETLDTGDWSTVHRLRNQTRLEIPLASVERAWTPQSWYLLGDVEPIFRSDTDRSTRCVCASGSATSPPNACWWSCSTTTSSPARTGGASSTPTTSFRLNFKLLTKHGLLARMGDDIDD